MEDHYCAAGENTEGEYTHYSYFFEALDACRNDSICTAVSVDCHKGVILKIVLCSSANFKHSQIGTTLYKKKQGSIGNSNFVLLKICIYTLCYNIL
jgi:hypothetical protein